MWAADGGLGRAAGGRLALAADGGRLALATGSCVALAADGGVNFLYAPLWVM